MCYVAFNNQIFRSLLWGEHEVPPIPPVPSRVWILSLSVSLSLCLSVSLSLCLSVSLSLCLSVSLSLISSKFFSDDCSVTEEGTGETKPCIFPFKYKDQAFTQCTTVNDPQHEAWCSTEVDSDGNQVPSGGFWGHCVPECENQLTEVLAELSFDVPGNFI